MIVRGFLVVLLFALLSLLAFGSVINGELITVDDPDQITSLQKRHTWNLEQTFIRKNTTGMYYRPLITLSFTADKMLWNADLRAMHLVNIALHTLNAIMVLLLTRFLLRDCRYSWLFALLGGVLFLWHPLTTESVNWISGRTDILAATFVFSSALALLRFRLRLNYVWLFIATLLAVCGVLAKETSIAFLAGFFFLLWAQDDPERLNLKRVAQRSVLLLGLLAVAGGSAWYGLFQLREAVLKADSSQIGLTIRIMDTDWWYSVFVCLRALGFYFKKIFLPWPLNFAIIEVDPLYELLAISLLVLLVYLFIKRSMVGGYALTGAVLVSPAFVIAFNQIAWTSYAERYVYISLGFILPIVVLGMSVMVKKRRAWVLVPVLLVLVFFATTFHRSWQWKTNEALWADTVKRSPLSEKAWNNYAVALMQQGRFDEAEKYFAIAASKYKFGYHDKYDINMAVSMLEQQEFQRAKDKLWEVMKLSNGQSNRALDVLFEAIKKQGGDFKQGLAGTRMHLKALALETDRAAYFYQLGRLEAYAENHTAAQKYFVKAYNQAEDSDPVRKKAEKAISSH